MNAATKTKKPMSEKQKAALAKAQAAKAAKKREDQEHADAMDRASLEGHCPRGGEHVWTSDPEAGREEFCEKCFEPHSAVTNSGAHKSAPKATTKKAKTAGDKPKKLSALDAAAQVLAASKEPLNAKQMIEAMAAKGLWTSPGGKTPHATLYSAILRDLGTDKPRFAKTERGMFTLA